MADDDQKVEETAQPPAAEPAEETPVEKTLEQPEKAQETAQAEPIESESIATVEDQNEETSARGDAQEGSLGLARNDSEDGPRETGAAGPRAEEEQPTQENQDQPSEPKAETAEEPNQPTDNTALSEDAAKLTDTSNDDPNAKWFVVHTYSGHENKVATALKQRVESEHLEHKILDVLVPTQEKIEIRGGKKATVKEKIFPGYILVKMILDDNSWLAVRTTQGVTSFVGIGNKPTPVPEAEVKTIVRFMTQGAAPTFKDVFMVDDTVKIIDGPFSEFIGKVDTVDKEHGKVRVLVSIFGRETPVELDFLQVQKL